MLLGVSLLPRTAYGQEDIDSQHSARGTRADGGQSSFVESLLDARKPLPLQGATYCDVQAWRVKNGELYRMDGEIAFVLDDMRLPPPLRAGNVARDRLLLQFCVRQDGVRWSNDVIFRPTAQQYGIRVETSLSEEDFEFQGRHQVGTPRFERGGAALDRTARNLTVVGPDKPSLEGVESSRQELDARLERRDALATSVVWMRADEDALPGIIAALKRKDASFFVAALFAGAHGARSESAVPHLIDALNDDGTTERRLENAREDKTGWRPRAAAAEALGRIGPVAKEAVPRLTELLNDEFKGVRYQAAIALGEIRHPDPEAIAALEALAKSTNDVRLREFAEDSLWQLQRAARNEAKKSPAP